MFSETGVFDTPSSPVPAPSHAVLPGLPKAPVELPDASGPAEFPVSAVHPELPVVPETHAELPFVSEVHAEPPFAPVVPAAHSTSSSTTSTSSSSVSSGSHSDVPFGFPVSEPPPDIDSSAPSGMDVGLEFDWPLTGEPVLNPDCLFDFLDPYTYTFMCTPEAAEPFEFDSEEETPVDPESLDHTHQLLFGYSRLESLSDTELDNLVPCNDLYGKLSTRRTNLFVVPVLVNGCIVRAMVDTGYTGFLLLDPSAAERTGVKPKVVAVPDSVIKGGKAHVSRDLTVGDQRVVQVTQCETCDINVGGYKTSATPWTMPLGEHFHAVLGLEFFQHLQANCAGKISWDFLQGEFSFTTKPGAQCKTSKRFSVSSRRVPAAMLEAPFCTRHHLRSLVTKTAEVPHDLPDGTRVLRLDDSFNIIRTREGDDFVVHKSAVTSNADPGISVSDTPASSSPGKDGTTSSSPTPTPRHTPSSSDSAASRSASGGDRVSDDWDGRKLVEDAVRDADRKNWVMPQPNPKWEPTEPSESDCFREA